MADQSISALTYALTRHRPPVEAMSGPQEAVVVSADATGVRFRMPGWHPEWAFGPAYMSRPSTAVGYPPPGTRCLVQFVNGQLSRAWVVAFAGWPA